MRNRYYDPKSGRFTQEAPIGIAGGLNVYGFANGDPVTYSDPYGLDPCQRFTAWTDCFALALSQWGGENQNSAALYLGAALSAALEATAVNALATAGNHIGSGRVLRGSAAAIALIGGGIVGRSIAGWVSRGLSRASSGAGRYDELIGQVQEWLGDGARVIPNRAGDKNFISRDGTRRIRFDINRPHPRVNPPAHVEELVDGRWVVADVIQKTWNQGERPHAYS